MAQQVTDLTAEVEKLRRKLSQKDDELVQAQEMTAMFQQQVKDAYQKCDEDTDKRIAEEREALEQRLSKAEKKNAAKVKELEDKLDDAASALEELDRKNDTLEREKDALRTKLADTANRMDTLQGQLETARDVADTEGHDLAREQQRVAALEVELETVRQQAQEALSAAAAGKDTMTRQLADMDKEMDKLKAELVQALAKSDELQVVVEEYEKGSRKAPGSKDSVLAAQQVQYLTEQVAMKDRQLVAKDRQLTALKAEREELTERADEAAQRSGPAAPSAELLDKLDLAERTVAALKRERDEIMSRLEEGSRSAKTATGKSIAEKLAEEKAEAAEAAAEKLRAERTELRRKVEELQSSMTPAVADVSRKADVRIAEAERRADVSERQLSAVRAERDDLRRKLDESLAGGMAVVSSDSVVRTGALSAVRDELMAVQAEVSGVIDKLRDREKVLAKVLAKTHVSASAARLM